MTNGRAFYFAQEPDRAWVVIFLLIFPIHFGQNAIWLLFQGNWDNLPTSTYLLPLAEFLLAILIFTALKKAKI